MRTLLAILIGLSILLSACATEDHSQTSNPGPTQTDANTLRIDQLSNNTLPSDLLFTTTIAGTPRLTVLMRVDARTLQMSPFYKDNSAFMRALSWSPSGDLLAILRRSPSSDYLEICLLTREGVLQSCFEDKIVGFEFRERGKDYMVTWSEDGHYIYFVTDYDQYHRAYDEIQSWGVSLVETEVATGQTQQVFYQTQAAAHYPPPELYWTEALHYLQLYNLGQDTPTGPEWLSKIIDLSTNTEIALPQDLPDPGRLEYCSQFSPQGQYLTARVSLNDMLSGWALVTPEGEIVQTLGSDKLQAAGIDWMECPVWLSDETAFYFLGGPQDNRASLFKYVLADNSIVKVKPLYPPDPQDSAFVNLYPQMPMRLAPDDATLAITFRIPGATEVHILTPTNEWVIYDKEETPVPVGSDPIWFPIADPD